MQSTKANLELWTELISGLAWPIVALIVLIVFWSPLRNLIIHAKSVGWGSLTVTEFKPAGDGKINVHEETKKL